MIIQERAGARQMYPIKVRVSDVIHQQECGIQGCHKLATKMATEIPDGHAGVFCEFHFLTEQHTGRLEVME